jgi:dTDP-4-dehydrorhamnose 3,5-epimerase
VLSDEADVVYLCSDYWNPELERAIAYDDPEIGIEWPVGDVVPSERDAAAPSLREAADELRRAYAR